MGFLMKATVFFLGPGTSEPSWATLVSHSGDHVPKARRARNVQVSSWQVRDTYEMVAAVRSTPRWAR
ncbi:hypothetical protein BV882_25940 [Streptomyces sp. 46]|nr:hypothetical protein BV882_25940 [Streptomyces sp. 46]